MVHEQWFFSAGRKTHFFRARAFRNIHILLVGCTLRVQIVCLLFFKKHFRISEKNAFTDCFDLSNVSHCRMSNSHMFFRLYDFPQLNRHKITINLHIFDAYLGSPWNHGTFSFMEYTQDMLLMWDLQYPSPYSWIGIVGPRYLCLQLPQNHSRPHGGRCQSERC